MMKHGLFPKAKQILALMLCLCMMLSYIPAGALAEEIPEEEDILIQEEVLPELEDAAIPAEDSFENNDTEDEEDIPAEDVQSTDDAESLPETNDEENLPAVEDPDDSIPEEQEQEIAPAYPWENLTAEALAAYLGDEANWDYLRFLVSGGDEEVYASLLNCLEAVFSEDDVQVWKDFLSSLVAEEAQQEAEDEIPTEEELTEPIYPWDGMSDEEFAEWIFDNCNFGLLVAMVDYENEDAYCSFMLRLEEIQDESLYTKIEDFLSEYVWNESGGKELTERSDKIITSAQIESAIAWAENRRTNANCNNLAYKGLCFAFVMDCYDNSLLGKTLGNRPVHTLLYKQNAHEKPVDAAPILVTSQDMNPPRGAFVFWNITSGQFAGIGHVALSLGNGKIIHSWSGDAPYVVEGTVDRVNDVYGKSNYLGWGAPIKGYVLETASGTTSIPVTSISLSGRSHNMDLGGSMTLKAEVAPTNATNKILTWKSSNTSVATVDSSGKVTAKATGEAVITATNTASGKKGEYTIKVVKVTNNMTVSEYLTYWPFDNLCGFVSPKTASGVQIWVLPTSVELNGVKTGKTNGTMTKATPIIAKGVNHAGNTWYRIGAGFVYSGDVNFTGKDHSWSWTKKDDNYCKGTCTVCGAVQTGKHTWDSGTVTKAATCTAKGQKTFTCTTCYAAKTQDIAIISHKYSNYKVTLNPTINAKGTLTGTCSVCKAPKAVTLPILDKTTNYTYSTPKAATCTTAGTGRYTWKTTTYGTITVDVTINATGHSYGSWEKLDANNHKHTCSKCSGVESEAHSWTDGKCTNINDTANHERTCSKCTATKKEAHTWDKGVVTTQPTDTTVGKKTYTCLACKQTKKETIPMNDYLALCTPYPSSCILETTKRDRILTLPITHEATTAVSEIVEWLDAGTRITSTGIYQNASSPEAHYYYQVVAPDGKTGYFWAPSVKVISVNSPKFTNAIAFPAEIMEGDSAVLSGRIQADMPLYAVTVRVQGTSLSYTDNNNGNGLMANSYTIPAKMANALKFETLTPGEYTLVMEAISANYFAADGTNNLQTPGDRCKTTVFEKKFTILHEHIWGEPIVAEEPTMTTTGSLDRDCIVDGCGTTQSLTLPLLTASCYFYEESQAPGCATAGVGTYTLDADEFGVWAFNVEIPATGHEFANYYAVHAPTLEASGTLTGSCIICDEEDSVEIPALDEVHYTKEIIRAVSCNADGILNYALNSNEYGNFRFTVIVDCSEERQLHHKPVYSVQTAPTLTEEGMLIGICPNCDSEEAALLPVLDETDYDITVLTMPTETTPGVGQYTWKETAYGSFSFEAEIPTLPIPENSAKLVMESATSTAGKQIILNLDIQNNPGIAGLAISLEYNTDVLTLVDAANAGLLDGFTKSRNFLWDSSENVTEDGTLGRFTFDIAENAEPGDYPVCVILLSTSDEDLNDVELFTVNGCITVIDVVYGDANGDTKVDMKDVVLLRKYIANFDYSTNTSNVEAGRGADANGDNKIDMKDVVLLRRYIANYDYTTDTSSVVLGPQ